MYHRVCSSPTGGAGMSRYPDTTVDSTIGIITSLRDADLELHCGEGRKFQYTTDIVVKTAPTLVVV